MKRLCFSLMPSGHKYRPLDGALGQVRRLYCPRCGRVIPADELFNYAMWETVSLPDHLRDEMDPEPVH